MMRTRRSHVKSGDDDDGIHVSCWLRLCVPEAKKHREVITHHEAPVDREAYTGRYERLAPRLGYPSRPPKSEHD